MAQPRESPPAADGGRSGRAGEPPPGGSGPAGAALAWAGWWLALLALWLVLANKLVAQELAAGALAAALGATAAVLVRQERRRLLRPRAVWVARLWRPLASVPRDVALLATALITRPRGELIEVQFAGGDDQRAAGRRVLAAVGGSVAPNTIVVDVDEERGVLLVHRLVARGDARRAADPLGLA